jgi:hypothetical protein
MEHRLAYRIQELIYGGLKPETRARLRSIAEQLDAGGRAKRRKAGSDRPIAGTRLIREYQGVEHCVTVRDEDFEYRVGLTNPCPRLRGRLPAHAGMVGSSLV